MSATTRNSLKHRDTAGTCNVATGGQNQISERHEKRTPVHLYETRLLKTTAYRLAVLSLYLKATPLSTNVHPEPLDFKMFLLNRNGDFFF